MKKFAPFALTIIFLIMGSNLQAASLSTGTSLSVQKAGIFIPPAELKVLDFPEALKVAAKDNKYIILYFWSESCKYCEFIQTSVFPDKDVLNALNKSFVVVSINSDKDQTNMGKKYKVRAVPTFLFMTSDGEAASILPGAVPADILVKVLDYVSTGSYKTMEFEDFAENKGI